MEGIPSRRTAGFVIAHRCSRKEQSLVESGRGLPARRWRLNPLWALIARIALQTAVDSYIQLEPLRWQLETMETPANKNKSNQTRYGLPEL